MPDHDNDEIQGSLPVRDSSKKGEACCKKARGEVCPKGRTTSILLKLNGF
jgi:hypothetical protein